ncbi:hypothetical protein [Psychroserpens ponticola]|uniref:LPS export ABC transporter periplasmic protein LptC n=1 Tax=Psychroserpens ponticola TaxID=2932268 RepID=A0ABY7RVP1_9FLAO|nr:hypothetical protein [Psychroserpens ponticola]WCO00316.1 hypothetical protein MUN68_009555 [Psychroserpens ponticola]
MLRKCFILSILSIFLIGCIGYHKILKDTNGEPILNEKVNYKFTKIPSKTDLTKIDTSAHYIQIFEGRYYNENEKQNPDILVFHNDGFYKQSSSIYNFKYESRNKNSIYYGGKYRITDDIIELEQFLPSKSGKTNYYSRTIKKGIINGDRIIFNDGNTLITIFEKKINSYKTEN